jgi:hypothetical protein
MLQRWAPLTFLLLVGTCAAAGKITFVPVPGVSAPAKGSPCKIDVISGDIPAGKYLELGTINFHAEWHRSRRGVKAEEAIQKIREWGCQVGADAIGNIQTTEEKRLEFAFINVRVTAVRSGSQ